MKNRLLLLPMLLFTFVFAVQSQTTQFSYQGSLKDGANPANGNYDFEFVLFDALSGGTQLGSTNTRNNVPVINGIFGVNLDFGSQFSSGDNRWLEVRVRPTGGGAFTPLTPRQQINSAPYALKSVNADTAVNATNATNAATATNALQLGGVAANQYVLTGDARLSDARNPLPNSASYIQNTTSQQASSNFNISGNGTAGGTLSGNTVNAATQYNLGGNRVLSTPGSNNLFVGFDAGPANTTGVDNTFLGPLAGYSNTTGSNNAFFGAGAGRANMSGNHNAFFGAYTGHDNTTGTYNAFFGYQAGFRNTIGNTNAFFGPLAGQANTTGIANSFFGHQAGYLNTMGGSNAFYGTYTGFSNTTGHSNAFYGANSGHDNTTGSLNTFFGGNAGAANTTGLSNAFFGTFAGQANTVGGGNTIIGMGANLGAGNLMNATALGSLAMVGQSDSLVLGSINNINGATADTRVGIGTTTPQQKFHVVGNGLFTGDLTVSGTLTANLPGGSANYIQNSTSQQSSSNFNVSGTGTANIFNAATQYNIGGNRVLSITSAGNLFAGVGAGQANTTGLDNAFFGTGAGQSNTIGPSNAFFGTGAGYNNTMGYRNAFFGASAGIANTTGFSNAFFGASAGNVNTTGNNNTVIGMQANLGAGDLTNATALGARALVGQSNSLVLGSINGINGCGPVTLCDSVNVGIGTTTPQQKFHVVGNGLFAGDLTVSGTLTATLPGGSVNYIQNQNVAPQTNSNFNISGTGTGNIFDAATQFNLGGNRVLSAPGSDNFFAGVGAGLVNTTGNFNTFVGSNVGLSNTTGGGNTFFGASAGEANTTGGYNAFFGWAAGHLNTGYYNAFFGTSAGQANTTGSANTIIGNGANLGSNNLGNATALGALARVDQSNALVLGSINGVNNATADTNVGIGTTTPGFRLDVVGRSRFRQNSGATGLTNSAGFWLFQNQPNADRAFVGMENDNTVGFFGNNGGGWAFVMNTQTGVARLNNLGSAGATSLCRNASNEISTCSSSLRYKTNIQRFTDGMSFVNQLRPISFHWKDGGMKDVGFGAEDIEKIDPRFVTYNSQGEVEGVKYDQLSVVLINAIKEQQQVIENLQRQIIELKKQVCLSNIHTEICKEEPK
jgi:hypothetical protein